MIDTEKINYNALKINSLDANFRGWLNTIFIIASCSVLFYKYLINDLIAPSTAALLCSIILIICCFYIFYAYYNFYKYTINYEKSLNNNIHQLDLVIYRIFHTLATLILSLVLFFIIFKMFTIVKSNKTKYKNTFI